MVAAAGMLRTIGRVVVGYAAACLAAGATQTLFVIDPTFLAGSAETTAGAGLLWMMAATQAAVFALPFAAIGIVLTEWRALRGWLTFVLLGSAIAVTAYAVAVAGETGRSTLLNDYAFKAFLASGIVAGLAYWMVAGRRAGAGHMV